MKLERANRVRAGLGLPPLGASSLDPRPALIIQSKHPLFSPGEIFSLVIFKITGKRTGACGVCGQRKLQMNKWGWWGCWKNRKTIIDWLCQEAKKRGHSVEEADVWVLFKAAFREMRVDRR